MTPLAAKVARELTLPKKDRTFDDSGHVLALLDQEMHCFEVSAIGKSVNAVLDDPLASEDADEAWSVWRDIESMLPRMFLPSPVTWLEQVFNGCRIACVIQEKGPYFSLSTVHQSPKGNYSLHICNFRARGILEPGERIEVDATGCEMLPDDDKPDIGVSDFLKHLDPAKVTPEQVKAAMTLKGILEDRIDALDRRTEMARTGLEVTQMIHRFIGMTVLTLDLINTPGLIGLKQREINKGLARSLNRAGRYPLLAWSEVVLKHQTKHAEPGEQLTGATYHKCLHFVRSHLRHYRDGHVTVIPAHWRGDPALGIKRTRYRLAA